MNYMISNRQTKSLVIRLPDISGRLYSPPSPATKTGIKSITRSPFFKGFPHIQTLNDLNQYYCFEYRLIELLIIADVEFRLATTMLDSLLMWTVQLPSECYKPRHLSNSCIAFGTNT